LPEGKKKLKKIYLAKAVIHCNKRKLKFYMAPEQMIDGRRRTVGEATSAV